MARLKYKLLIYMCFVDVYFDGLDWKFDPSNDTLAALVGM